MADYDYQAELKKKQLEEEAASETDATSTDETSTDETDNKPVEEEAQAERKKIGGPGYQIQFIRQESPGLEPAPKPEVKPAPKPVATPEDPGSAGGPDSFTDTATDEQVVAPPPQPSTKVIAPPLINGVEPAPPAQDMQGPEDVTHYQQEQPTPPPVAPPPPEAKPEEPAPPAPLTSGQGFWGGDLTKGPPGAPPADGSDDRPFWPKSDKDIALLPPGTQYIDPKDRSQKTTPAAQTPPPASQASKPAPDVQVGTMQNGKFVPQEQQPSDQQPAAPPVKIPETIMGLNRIDKEAADAKPADVAPLPTANPDGTPMPTKIAAPNGRGPVAIVFHHTSGRGGPDGVRSTLEERGLGVQLIVDRAGNIVKGGGDFHSQIRPGYGPNGAGLDNSNTIGVEFIANNNRDITPAQKEAAKRIAAMYPDAVIKGHGEVNPGHKEADEGQATKQAALAWRNGGTTGKVSTDNGDISLKGYITTRATQFGHFDPDDEGVGAPRLGQLDTNDARLIGLAVPEEQLRRQFGNHPELWRKARADVVLADGTHVMVPIVDIGPSDEQLKKGIGVDMTYGMTKLLNHNDETSTYKVKLIGDAGPDVTKDPKAFLREQAQLAKNGPQPMQPVAEKYGMYGGERVEVLNNGASMSPAEKVSQETAQMYQNQPVYEQWHKLDSINVAQGGNRAKTLEILSNPIDGVNDNLRKDYLDDYKKDLVDFMRVHTNNPDLSEEDAIKQATAAPDVGSFTTEVVNRFLPNIDMAVKNFIGSFDSASENRLQQYAKLIEPDATPAQIKAFKDHLLTVPKEELAGVLDTYNEEAKKRMGLGPNDNVPMDMATVMDSVRRLQSPAYQKDRQDLINAKAKIGAQLANSPNFEGTAAGKWASFIAQAPAMLMQIMSGPIGERSMISDIFSSTEDRIRAEHPDWDDDKIREMASASTLAQYAPAAIGLRAAGGKISKWFKGVEENPNMVARIGMSGALHGGIGAAAGAIQSGLGNLAENKDVDLQAAEEQALFGGIQGAVGGMIGGIHRKGNIDHIPVDERLPSDHDRIVKPDSDTPTDGEPPVRPGDTGPAPDEGDRGSGVKPGDTGTTRDTKATDTTVTGDVEDQLSNDNKKKLDESTRKAADEPVIPPGDTTTGGTTGDTTKTEPGKPLTQDEADKLKPNEPTPDEKKDITKADIKKMPKEIRKQALSILNTKLTDADRAPYQPLFDAVQKAFANDRSGRSEEMVQAYRKLNDALLKRYQPHIDALGARVLNEKESVVKGKAYPWAAGQSDQGDLHLYNNTRKGAADLASWMRDGHETPESFVQKAIQEEVIHLAHIKALKNNWIRANGGQKPANGFHYYISKRHSNLLEEAINLRDKYLASKDTKIQFKGQQIKQALEDSTAGYHGMNRGQLGDATWGENRVNAIAADLKSGHLSSKGSSLVFELVRQLTQLEAHGGVTEEGAETSLMTKVRDWWVKAKEGLQWMLDSTKTGGALANTDLARMLKAVNREIAKIDQAAAKAGEKGTKTTKKAVKSSLSSAEDFIQEIRKAQAGEALAGNRPAASEDERSVAAELTKPTAKDRWANLKTKFSTVFKGGESTMLDQDETKGLARLIRQRPSLEQKIGSNIKIHDFYDAWDSVRGVANKARVTQEIGDYMKAREKGQPLPAISPDTQKLVKAWDDLAHLTAGEMQRLNIHVMDSKSKIRPFNRLGYGKYFPHTFSADFRDMMAHRDGARKADFDARVASDVAAGKVRDRNEFIDRYDNANTSDLHSNEPFSNMERAREGNFNIDDMDVTPEAMMRYANRSTRKLAQVEAYGQKLSSKGKDAFDHTVKQVQDSPNLTPQQKDMITTRILQEQNAEYSNRHKDNHSDLVGHFTQVASGAFLGNPLTSMANLIGGGAHNLAVGGMGSFGKTLLHSVDLAKAFAGKSSLVKEANERGILRENLRNLMRNYEQVTDQNWMTHGVQGFNQKMLKWGGQHATEAINRAFSMQQGKEFLKEFYKGYGNDNTKMRWIYKHLEQLGISKSEQADLYKERGTGPVTDEMLRQWVMDTHGNYGPSQAASHIFDSPAGRMLGQFQKWSVNAGRIATRQFVAPMIRSGTEWTASKFTNKKAGADFAYHVGRNLFLLGTAMGAGSLQQAGRDMMMGRQNNDPTYQDILKRMAMGDGRAALGEGIHKMWDTVILSGMSGQFGNYAELARQLDPSQNIPGRVKDPMHPPALGLLQPFIQLGQTAVAEGGLRGKTLDTFLGQMISGYRTMKPLVQATGGALGVPGMQKGAQSLTAQNQINFMRTQIQQYAEENPGVKKGISIPFTPDPFAPVRDGFHSALIRGDSTEANAVINKYLQTLAPGERGAALKKIQSSIRESVPAKIGNSIGLPPVTDFLQWAKNKLPENESRELFASERTYAQAALETGIFDKDKTMRFLSKLDYDKFGGPVQKKANTSAAESTLRHFYQKAQAQQTMPPLRQ